MRFEGTRRSVLRGLRLAAAVLAGSAVVPNISSAQDFVWANVPSARVRNFNNLNQIVVTDVCPDPEREECAALLELYNAPGAALPAAEPASVYPSTIQVPAQAFVAGSTITDVNVVIRGVEHRYLDDLDILLVGPGGQYVVLASNVSAAGGGDVPNGVSVTNLNWKFDDSARLPLPNANNNDGRASNRATVRVNGELQPNPLYELIYPEWINVWTDSALRSYKPSDYDNGGDDDVFPAPAPQGLVSLPSVVAHDATTGIPAVSGGTPLGVFNGTSPAGTWSLYVVDDYFWFDGAIQGWELQITAKQP